MPHSSWVPIKTEADEACIFLYVVFCTSVNFKSARILPWYTNSSSSCSVLITLCKIALINLFYSYISCIAFIFSYQLKFGLWEGSVRADRSTFLLSMKQHSKKLEHIWWGKMLRHFVVGRLRRTGRLPPWPVSSAVLELSRTAVAVSSAEGIQPPVLLAQSPPATLGKAWLFVLQHYSESRRPSAGAAHSYLGSTASPSQPTAGMANSTWPKRPHFKYSLLGKTCCPSGGGIISHHSNLFGVLIKYLILLHHLTIAAGKVVFSHHAHSAPITETHYSSTQPGGEHTVCFCSLGRTTARSHREPLQLWCEKLLSSPVALPDSRRSCAAASGTNLHGFHVWQPGINTSKHHWSGSSRQQV